MGSVVLAGGIDVAELAFWAFILFFIGLVFVNRREDRREGYPLENELTGKFEDVGGPLTMPSPKLYRLPGGQGRVFQPRFDRDAVKLPARPLERMNGSPLVPTGDPLADGIGPASWVPRMPVPDIDMEGRPRIVPLSSDPDFFLAKGDPDPRGFRFVTSDGRTAGKVVDIWIDRSDRVIRYLGVELLDGGRRVLAPIYHCHVHKRRGAVSTDSINADQLTRVPAVTTDGQITRREEDQIMGYFGGGYLYSTPTRAEPLV